MHISKFYEGKLKKLEKRRKICVILKVSLVFRHYFSNFVAEFATIHIV